MDIISYIEEIKLAHLESFTEKIKTSWGFLFCNEDNPNYYDANHAYIREVPNNPERVVNEVISFYEDKQIIPRFYIYNIEKQNKLLKELKKKGFKLEEFIDPIQVWNSKVEMEPKIDDDIVFEQVNSNNFNDALKVQCSIKEFGGKEVREKAFKTEFNNPNYSHFLLKYNNIPCSIACVFKYRNQGILENVAIVSEFRGNGLIGKLIYHIKSEVNKDKIDKLWVFPISKKVENIYQKYGFQTVDMMKTGHAFLNGKSIKDVQDI